MISYSILWGIATFIIVMVQCVPVSFFWNRAYLFYGLDPPNNGSCLDTRASQIPPALLSTVGDLMLLALPFPVLLRLQISWRRKIELTFIFGLGIFVAAASIVRFRYIWFEDNAAHPTWDDAETLVWTPVECFVGVICACITCMAPLRRLANGGITREGYKPTGEGGAAEIPLTMRAWPGEHSMFHSQHGKNDGGSSEFDGGGWTSTMATVIGKTGELESQTPVHASDFRSVVVNGASADPRASGIREEVPSNHIKVSKDMMWSEETAKGSRMC